MVSSINNFSTEKTAPRWESAQHTRNNNKIQNNDRQLMVRHAFVWQQLYQILVLSPVKCFL